MSLWQKIKLIFVTIFTRHFHQTYCKTCVADEDFFSTGPTVKYFTILLLLY